MQRTEKGHRTKISPGGFSGKGPVSPNKLQGVSYIMYAHKLRTLDVYFFNFKERLSQATYIQKQKALNVYLGPTSCTLITSVFIKKLLLLLLLFVWNLYEINCVASK